MSGFPSFPKTTSGRAFIKMHGLRNHFVITDGRDAPYLPGAQEIIRVCDPQTGVGGDQLIVLEPPRSAGANVFMRILNVDAREVEACGNATRCVAWLLLEEAGVDRIVIETLAGLIHCERSGDREVRCSMGSIEMHWQRIPLAREVDTVHFAQSFGPLSDGVCLSIGNPHIVFFVDDINAVPIEELAPAIQSDSMFPNSVNVGIAEVVAEDHLRSVVYERGAGLTTACGSGACVAVYAALVREKTRSRTMRVSMPAGDVTIDIGDGGVAAMTGPVAYCFSGSYPEETES